MLDALNSQMRANQVVLKQRAADDATTAAAQLAQREAEVQDLKEQVLPRNYLSWVLPLLGSQGIMTSPVQYLNLMAELDAGFWKECTHPLQVHDLMMFLEGQRQLAEAGPDVQQGSVSIPPQPASQPNSRSTRRATKGRQ